MNQNTKNEDTPDINAPPMSGYPSLDVDVPQNLDQQTDQYKPIPQTQMCEKPNQPQINMSHYPLQSQENTYPNSNQKMNYPQAYPNAFIPPNQQMYQQQQPQQQQQQYQYQMPMNSQQQYSMMYQQPMSQQQPQMQYSNYQYQQNPNMSQPQPGLYQYKPPDQTGYVQQSMPISSHRRGKTSCSQCRGTGISRSGTRCSCTINNDICAIF